jgi:hypothetical protein
MEQSPGPASSAGQFHLPSAEQAMKMMMQESEAAAAAEAEQAEDDNMDSEEVVGPDGTMVVQVKEEQRYGMSERSHPL